MMKKNTIGYMFILDEYEDQKELTTDQYLSHTLDNREDYCIRELQQFIKYNIIRYKDDHAGYIKELNIYIEFDFEYRYLSGRELSPRYVMLDEKLKNRTGCEIFRIREKNWINHKDSIIESFLVLIERLEKNENNK